VTKLLVFIFPTLVIIFFWALSRLEARLVGVTPRSRGFFRRNGTALGLFLIIAVGIWTVVFIVLPNLYMVQESFRLNLPSAQRGGPSDVPTIDNYVSFIYDLSFNEWNWVDMYAFGYTIVASLFVTFLSLITTYPLAFYLAYAASKRKLRNLMVGLVIPYWVSGVLVAFAFGVLFAARGPINSALIGVGLLDQPFNFRQTNVALYIALVAGYVLMMLFPLYAAIQSLDRNQIEAARDLGAPWHRIHVDIIMPHAKPGIAAGCTLVFMGTAGSLAYPQILGGTRTLWFTPIVHSYFFESENWPRGAAYAFILLLACVVFVMAVLRMFKVSLGEAVR
jgi:spermidine/putrescine transport system permease protein